MKKFLFTVSILILSVLAYSQTVLEQPKVGMSTASNVKIEKIELRETATVLWFLVKDMQGNSISIPKETYIQSVGAKEKLFVVAAEGIQLNEKCIIPASGEISYQLIFPKVDASVTKIDYGEANDVGSWFIYDIQLKPELFKSVVPEKMTGNWFRSDNAQWEVSLFESVAVYKSQVWKYLQYTEKDGIGKIRLKNGLKNLDLYTKMVDNGVCMIGETPAKLAKFTHEPVESAITVDNESFKLPVFKVDTAIYCGYIKGFNSRVLQKTGTVSVNDELTGQQNSFPITISNDGTFKIKIPHTNPQTVYVQLPFYFETIFIEPGKTTFQLIDKGSKTNPTLFMGDDARINSELLKLKDINSINYDQLFAKILDFSPEQYKAYLQDLRQKDLTNVDEVAQKHSLSAKAVQIKKLEIDCHYASTIMEYSSRIEAAYRKKNNIPQTQRDIPFKPTKPDSSYYNFLTNDLVNNPLTVLTSECYFFINRIKYMDILRSNAKNLTIPEIVAEMDKSGYKLAPEEKELAKQLKEVDTPESKTNEFQAKYSKQSKGFYSDHRVFISGMSLDSRITERNEKLQKVLGIQPGFATDIMASRDICIPIVAEMTPYSDEKLKAFQKGITTPFIASYIKLRNDETRAKIEANKKKKACFTINEVPKTTSDKVFDAIMAKYKGKVVYVDFWATWCAPCRALIEQVRPLKDEMAGENVVFVYISAPSSPKTTYDNMIPTIKGEHYRVSADEWNALGARFKISTIPHCALVGKDGKVINPKLEHLENSQLKALLMKYIKE